MTLVHLLIVIVFTAFFSIQVLALVWILRKETDPSPVGELPRVSLLLAARNEEDLIIRSLKHIYALNYPKDRLQVLIGDDGSTDRTAELVQEFIADRPQFELIPIKGLLGKGRGKANVLAHLAHYANGDFYMITDVDVALPPNWVRGMLAQFEEGVGIVSGTTMCDEGGLFASMQRIDWLHFMGYIKAFAQAGISCTSVGNNMAVRSEAYWQTGGYEQIEFSITEDYKLFKEVTSRGWGWRNQLNADTLGKAWYIPSVTDMLHQRKRWLIGAQELPWNWKALIALYGLFYPCLLVLLFTDPVMGIYCWMVKFALQWIFVQSLSKKVGEAPFRFHRLFTYEGYLLVNTLATALFYILPIPSVWKGRVYNKAYIRD